MPQEHEHTHATPAAAAATPLPPISALEIAAAIDLWNSGWQQANRHMMGQRWRDAYAQAVRSVAAAPSLTACTSMQDLLVLFYRTDHLLDDALEAAERAAYRKYDLSINRGIVEDAAFWQRFQSLLVEHLATGQSGQGEASR